MKKVYVQPELELLKVSASNEFLVGSPDKGIDNAETPNDWADNGDGNEWENENNFDNWN